MRLYTHLEEAAAQRTGQITHTLRVANIPNVHTYVEERWNETRLFYSHKLYFNPIIIAIIMPIQ